MFHKAWCDYERTHVCVCETTTGQSEPRMTDTPQRPDVAAILEAATGIGECDVNTRALGAWALYLEGQEEVYNRAALALNERIAELEAELAESDARADRHLDRYASVATKLEALLARRAPPGPAPEQEAMEAALAFADGDRNADPCLEHVHPDGTVEQFRPETLGPAERYALPQGWDWSDNLPDERDAGWQAVGPYNARAWTVGGTLHPALPGHALITYDECDVTGETMQSTPIPVVLAVLHRAGVLPGAGLTERLTIGSAWHVAFWDAVNAYADAGRKVYGNTRRMDAVAAIERLLAALREGADDAPEREDT